MRTPCQSNPDGWFPPDEEEGDWYESGEADMAREGCYYCPYLTCLEDNENLRHGIVGGLSPSERKSIRDARTRC